MNAVGRILFWLGWPVSYLALRRSWRTRALIRCGSEVLLIKNWYGANSWALPGGGLQPGERLVVGLLRELHEELGITLHASDCRRLGDYQFRFHGLPFQCHLFVVDLLDRPALQLPHWEISDAQWMSTEAVAAESCLPEVAESLRRLAVNQ